MVGVPSESVFFSQLAFFGKKTSSIG